MTEVFEEQTPQEAEGEQIALEGFEAQEAQDYAIRINPGDIEPRLDPNSPEFDQEAWMEIAAEATRKLRQTIEGTKQSSNPQTQEDAGGQSDDRSGQLLAAYIEAIPKSAIDSVAKAAEAIEAFLNSATYNTIKDSVEKLTTYWQTHGDTLAEWSRIAAEANSLAPFLEAELEADPDLKGYTIEDALALGFDDDGNITDGPFRNAIERARARRDEYQSAQEIVDAAEQAAEDLPRIISNPTELLSLPMDKPNSYIWNLLKDAADGGQIQIDIDTGKKGSKKDAVVYYSIDFLDGLAPDLKISKQLTPFDKRLYIAAAAIYNAGNNVTTTTQIHKMMGNRGRPTKAQIKKINDSLTKMGAARVYIDSTEEVKINKGYAAFKYDASLLPFERINAYINNTLTESAIHLFREPPMITFARERGQITNVTRQLLESPISKTDANLRLEDYLLERIGHMKNPKSKAPRNMLFTTIYERCHIAGNTDKERKERQRTPEKIRKYLDHYEKCGWIKGYTMEKTSVTIHL